MSDRSERIVKKLWSYCQVLRDDGLSYQDYLEQLTFLLFLKMADERAALTGEPQAIPPGFRWVDLANPKMEGVKLEQHYRDTLRKLGDRFISVRVRHPIAGTRALGQNNEIIFNRYAASWT